MRSGKAFIAAHRSWIAALVAVAAGGVLAGALIAGAWDDGDPEPASEAVEQTEPTEPAEPDRAGRPGGPRQSPERRGEERSQPSPPSSDGSERGGGASDRAAGVLAGPNPLRRARRQGLEVLRATPEGAERILEALGGGGDGAARALEQFFEERGK